MHPRTVPVLFSIGAILSTLAPAFPWWWSQRVQRSGDGPILVQEVYVWLFSKNVPPWATEPSPEVAWIGLAGCMAMALGGVWLTRLHLSKGPSPAGKRKRIIAAGIAVPLVGLIVSLVAVGMYGADWVETPPEPPTETSSYDLSSTSASSVGPIVFFAAAVGMFVATAIYARETQPPRGEVQTADPELPPARPPSFRRFGG